MNEAASLRRAHLAGSDKQAGEAVRVEGEVGQNMSCTLRRTADAQALRIEEPHEVFMRGVPLDQGEMRGHHEAARRPELQFAFAEWIGMGERFAGVLRCGPCVGRELGMLLPAQIPAAEHDMHESRILGRPGRAMLLAKRGDHAAILARLSVARRKGEMIDALRRFDRQERARMKFRENGRARLVLE